MTFPRLTGSSLRPSEQVAGRLARRHDPALLVPWTSVASTAYGTQLV